MVRKNGGSDDGKLYAMKTVNITHALEYGGSTKMIDFLNSECEVSISMNLLPFNDPSLSKS